MTAKDNNVTFLKGENKDKEKALQQSSAAWSDSLLYSGGSFPRYNPDDLIGRRGFDIYNKMMMDEQLKAVVRFRRDSISGREYGFEFDEDCTLSDDEKKRRKDIMLGSIKHMKGSFKDSLNKILASIHQGFSMTEKTFDLYDYDGKQYWGIKKLGKKPFDTFFFVTDEYGDLLRTYQEMDGREHNIDMGTIVHHVQNPDEDEYYGKSELREAYRSWFSKDVIIKFRNIHLERHASGFLWIGETEEGTMPAAGTADHAALVNIVNNFQVKTGILLPAGLEAHLEKPNNTTAFAEAIEAENRALAKALLMPNLMGFSEDGNVGSQAKSQTQLEAFLWILDSEAGGLEETLNEQLFLDIAEANFGDNEYPKFTFRPLSKAMMQTIATTWGDLVSKNAVVPSPEDEAHIRNIMDFPPKPTVEQEEEDNTAVDQKTALAGAQVASMMDVITQVASGQIPWETGVLVLTNSFPVSREKAEEMLAAVPKELFDPEKAAKAKGIGDEDKDDEDKDDEDDNDDEDKDDDKEDETLMGSHQTVIAYTRQLKRVNFSEIDRSSEIIINEGTMKLGTVINDIVQFFDKEINDKELYGKDTDPEVVNDLTVPASFNKKLQKESETFMRDAWELGSSQGKNEIAKAGNKYAKQSKYAEFTKQFGALGTDAASYFETRAFTMSGKLSTGTLDVIKGSILNGIKYSKTHPEIVKDIYASLAQYGYLNYEDAEEALGQALEITNPTARLMTTVRTSTFESINESRFNYFTDPSLEGFVQALEYSAILDARTTDICADMDERIYQLGSKEWNKYRPPNHFNCRSILIPVTEKDEWDETTERHNWDPSQGFS